MLYTRQYRYGKERAFFQWGLYEEWKESLARKGKD